MVSISFVVIDGIQPICILNFTLTVVLASVLVQSFFVLLQVLDTLNWNTTLIVTSIVLSDLDIWRVFHHFQINSVVFALYILQLP